MGHILLQYLVSEARQNDIIPIRQIRTLQCEAEQSLKSGNYSTYKNATSKLIEESNIKHKSEMTEYIDHIVTHS